MNQFSNNTYDLEERTAKFGEDIIKFCKTVKPNYIIIPILTQLIKAGTSIGANYCEANNASSRKDFRNKIFICKKEAQETKHWLKMLRVASPELTDEINVYLNEIQELLMIFQKICSSLAKKQS